MLTQLIEQEDRRAKGQILAAAALSGASNAAVLAIVNAAAQNPEQPSLVLLAMLFAAAALFTVSLRISVGMMSDLIETILHKLRIRLADKIGRAELLGLEGIGASELYERLTQQVQEISSAALPLALGVQGGVLLICAVFYLGYVSLAVLLLTLGIYGSVAVIYVMRIHTSEQIMQQTAGIRIRLLDVLTDLLYGFKEVRFRMQRRAAIQADFAGYSASLKREIVRNNLLQQESFVIANLSQFALLGFAVFVLPQFIGMNAQTVMQVTAALIFIFGPIGGLVNALPWYGRADFACKNLLALEARLDAIAQAPQSPNPQAFGGPFHELELVDVGFERADAAGRVVFAVGPISMSVKAGEIVFLVGGNGSGKTTLLRTMTALYPPTTGTLRVNGVPVTPCNVQSYREMIAAIFTDFHLFKKLYGLPEVQEEKVAQLLEQMAIADKTHVSEGTWSTVDLSTGQRKRVGMVVALLEARPIYIFDEWAADQDPEFRQYFYEELLPDLKRQGKTVIAISHDDRYFHCADRIVTLEYGKVRSVEEHPAQVLAAQRPEPAPGRVGFPGPATES